MIKVADLRRIKKTCFDRIAQNAVSKKDLSVLIKSINPNLSEVIFSNGADYARIVINQLGEAPPIEMSWADFCRVCEFFENEITIAIKGNTQTIKEGKMKMNCAVYPSQFNQHCNFKFDFQTAQKINIDELLVMHDHGVLGKWAINQNYAISSDGNICILNLLESDFGDNCYSFVDKFPAGKWFFSPKQNLIVSEDKLIAFSRRLATGTFPNRALLDFSKQHLSNWFEVSAEQFLSAVEKCGKVDEKILFDFGDNSLTIKAKNKEFADFETQIPCEYGNKTARKGFSFLYRYMMTFCKCADKNGKVRIMFDDNETVQMFRIEGKKLIIFGMGLIRK